MSQVRILPGARARHHLGLAEDLVDDVVEDEDTVEDVEESVMVP
ncbi:MULTISPECIES: hypothetical protein [unclassified Serinicoccus]|nr:MULTISPECIES: hypothetical protein [unclassified Serinicoccus]